MEAILAGIETALDTVIDELGVVERELPAYGMTRSSFGSESDFGRASDGAGMPGRVARQMREHWAAVLAARAAEAGEVAGRLRNLGADVHVTAEDYERTDTAVARRLRHEF